MPIRLLFSADGIIVISGFVFSKTILSDNDFSVS